MKWEVQIPSDTGGDSSKNLTIEAPNWIQALQSALHEAGQDELTVRNLACSIQEDQSVHVTDYATSKAYILNPLEKKEVSSGKSTEEASRKEKKKPEDDRAVSGAGEIVPAGDFPQYEIFFVRDEAPDESTGIIYRERLIVVSQDSTDADAYGTAKQVFEVLKNELSDYEGRRYINVAVFDHSFNMNPKRPALVSLVWKEWLGTEPNVFYPRNAPPQPSQSSPIPLIPKKGRPTYPPSEKKTMGQGTPDAQETGPSVIELGAPATRPAQQKPAQEEPEEKKAPAEKKKPGKKPSAQKKKKPAKKGRISTPPPESAISALGSDGDEQGILVEVFEHMQALYDIRDRQEAARFAFDLIRRFIPVDAGRCLTADVNGLGFEVVGAFGSRSKKSIGQKYPLRKGLYGFCVREGVAICINQAGNDERFAEEMKDRLDEDVKCVLCAPVQFEGRTFGIMELMNIKDQDGFTPIHVNVVSYITGQLAEHMDVSIPSADADFEKDFAEWEEEQKRLKSSKAPASAKKSSGTKSSSKKAAKITAKKSKTKKSSKKKSKKKRKR